MVNAPAALPALNASAHALNWMSQALWAAATLVTKVLPLTSKGRAASPESVTAGAAIPPSAAALETALGLLAVELVEDATTEELATEEAVETAATARVDEGASTQTVFVTRAQVDDEEAPRKAAAVV